MEKYKDIILKKITIQQPDTENTERVTSIDIIYSSAEDSLMDHVIAMNEKYNDLYSMYLDYKDVNSLKDLFIELNNKYSEKGVYGLRIFLDENFGKDVDIEIQVD